LIHRTAEYFARVGFVRAVEWLSRFEPIPEEIKVFAIRQDQKAADMKKEFERIRHG